MKIEPSLSFMQLSLVPPGSVVRLDGRYAIAASNSRQPPDKALATYDPAESIFQFSPVGDRQILAFTGEHVLRPDLESAFDGSPGTMSRNELYFDGDKPLVVLKVSSDFRLLDLSTGIFEASLRTAPMKGFRKWEICVRLRNGELMTLVKFSPHKSAETAATAVSGHMGR